MTAKIICENKNLEVSDLSNASPVYCKKDEIRIFSLFWELGKHSLRKIVDESFRRTLQSSVKCTSYLMKIWWEYVNMVYPMACESHSVSENFLIHLLRHSYPCFGTRAKNSLLLRNCVADVDCDLWCDADAILYLLLRCFFLDHISFIESLKIGSGL